MLYIQYLFSFYKYEFKYTYLKLLFRIKFIKIKIISSDKKITMFRIFKNYSSSHIPIFLIFIIYPETNTKRNETLKKFLFQFLLPTFDFRSLVIYINVAMTILKVTFFRSCIFNFNNEGIYFFNCQLTNLHDNKIPCGSGLELVHSIPCLS